MLFGLSLRKILCGPVLPLCFFITGLSVLAQDLEVLEGSRRKEVSSRTRDGLVFYRLSDLAEIFQLELREIGDQMRVQGPRATLTLLDGRPLIRLSDEYILLSKGSWRLRAGDWYVPPDFLDKALPGILNRKISRTSSGALRIESLGSNSVRVEAISYPDHLSIVFRSSESAPVEVRDFQDFIEVVYGGYLVNPEYIESPAEPGLISFLRFIPEEGYGSFRVGKGTRFRNFRHYELGSPPRLIVDIYGDPEKRIVEGPDEASDENGGVEDRSPVDETSPGLPTTSPRAVQRGVVVIDPGHGGDDYGVDVYLDELEKGISLSIAQKVQQMLEREDVGVHLTRFRDVGLDSEQRSAVANFYQASLYVGIHIGGSPAPSVRGPVVYVYSSPDAADGADRNNASEVDEGRLRLVEWEQGQLDYSANSRVLGALIQRRLNDVFETENAMVSVPLDVLAPIMAPAVVIEAGYLTNPDDRERLHEFEFHERIARAVASAIRSFVSAEYAR